MTIWSFDSETIRYQENIHIQVGFICLACSFVRIPWILYSMMLSIRVSIKPEPDPKFVGSGSGFVFQIRSGLGLVKIFRFGFGYHKYPNRSDPLPSLLVCRRLNVYEILHTIYDVYLLIRCDYPWKVVVEVGFSNYSMS